jgi:hypothetical protein
MRPEDFVAGPEGFPATRWDVVGPHYFSTIGTPILAGRDFTEQDDVTSTNVVSINEQMARVFFQGTNPIRRRLLWQVGQATKQLEIVSVVRDVKQSGPRDLQQPRFYLPYFQMPQVRPTWVLGSTRLLVRATADPAALAPLLRRLISAQDPRMSVMSLVSGPELVSRSLVRERMVTTLFVTFGVLAVGLACVGLYGLIAYHVVQHTNEIGIRMALGAQRGDVLKVLLRRAVVWIVSGVALGVPLALSVSRVAQGLLFGLSGTDAGALLTASGLVTAMGLLAAFLPAGRALRLDPLTALRAD